MSEPPMACVGALIFDPAGRLFLHRRAADRTLFAGCWDIVGGHVEPGERLTDALAREVTEETGWRVDRIIRVLPPLGWTGDDGRRRVEYDFVVTVHGDLAAPRLEAGQHTELRWVPADGLDLLRAYRTPSTELDALLDRLATAMRPAAPVDPELVAATATLAAQVDRAFVAAMGQLPRLAGGAEGVRARGGPAAVGALIEFRTSLGWPGRWVTEPEALAVARYRDAAKILAQLRGHADAGTLEIAAGGAFRATDAGHDFLRWLAGNQAEGLATWWAGQPVIRAAELLAPVLAAAQETGGAAWQAMAPAYEPAGTPDAVLLLNRLGTLRYHRADAHAEAWQADGRTAGEMAALADGAERAAIEARTNELAAAPWAALTPGERAELSALLAALPG